jgi:small nuclear ribonucleoprotein
MATDKSKLDTLKYAAGEKLVISMAQRPLDVLNRALGSSVLVGLKGGRELRGKLSGFDVHVNIVLEEAEEIQGGEASKRYGTMVIRGDSVVFISPAE